MKISDYLVTVLKENGVKTVFGVQGSGTVIQIFDSLGRIEGIDYVCTLHEQAAGMAADAYSQVTGGLGACVATCGPGATNFYTAVAGSYYNSNPVIYIIGQPQLSMMKKNTKVRHYGAQEIDDLSIFTPVAKYVAIIHDKETAKYEIEKAVHIAKSDRPGPVIIAIPDDVTWLDVDIDRIKGYTPEIDETKIDYSIFDEITERIKTAKRPIFLFGKGVKCAGANKGAKELVEKYNIPYALTWGARDLLSSESLLFVGSIGIQGSRSGNFAIQNADLIISVGARLDAPEIGSGSTFAREAYIYSVEIDQEEINKYEAFCIPVNKPVKMDAKVFIKTLLSNRSDGADYSEWISKISHWKKQYTFISSLKTAGEDVDPYYFVSKISDMLKSGDVITTDASSPKSYIYQAFKVKTNQKLISWLNFASLGYGIPGGIGSCFAHKDRVITITGDGGMQFNMQELATIKFYNLNMKIVVLDNGGFGNIYHVQNNFLDERHHGVNRAYGLPIPDIAKVCGAYGFPVSVASKNSEIESALKACFETEGPAVCIINLSMDKWITPKRAGKDPLEDMTPKLNREEFYREMIIEPIS